MTEAGFVRLSCQPAVTGVDVPVAQALALIETVSARPDCELWPDRLSLGEALSAFARRLSGHRQITDAYLLGLAIEREGVLATFDRRVAALLAEGSPHRRSLEVISV